MTPCESYTLIYNYSVGHHLHSRDGRTEDGTALSSFHFISAIGTPGVSGVHAAH